MNITCKSTYIFDGFTSFPGFACTMMADNQPAACKDLIAKLSGVIEELKALQNQKMASNAS